jgi:hypothetical protein
MRDGSEAQLESERLQKAIQSVLGGIVARVEGPQEIRARHPDLGREFLHAHRSNDFGKRHLKRNALIDRCEQKLASEFSVPKILR